MLAVQREYEIYLQYKIYSTIGSPLQMKTIKLRLLKEIFFSRMVVEKSQEKVSIPISNHPSLLDNQTYVASA